MIIIDIEDCYRENVLELLKNSRKCPKNLPLKQSLTDIEDIPKVLKILGKAFNLAGFVSVSGSDSQGGLPHYTSIFNSNDQKWILRDDMQSIKKDINLNNRKFPCEYRIGVLLYVLKS